MARKAIKLKQTTTCTLQKVFKDFIKYCRYKNLSTKTLQYYEDCCERFFDFYNDDNIENINQNTIQDFVVYLKNRNLATTSINCNLRAIRTFFNYMIKLGYLDKSAKVKLIKEDKTIKETYTDRELEILLEKPNLKKCNFAEYRNWVIINFLLATGCRANTLINIKIKDLNLQDNLVTYKVTKNRKQQIIPISNTLSIILQEYLTYRDGKEDDYLFCSVYGSKMNNNSLNQAISKYNKSRGVMKTSIHLFRHTFAKKWIQAGGNIFSLQKMLGHSSLDMVKIYVNLFGQDIKRDYDKYNALEQFTNTNYITMQNHNN